jgi:hypothetical protein
MKFDLQLRNLQTGDRSTKTFETVDEAKAWLTERPKFIEVLGVASHHVSREISNDLRSVVRPLDAEEELLERQLEQALQDVARERAETRKKKEMEDAERHKKEMASADPNRPMDIRYLHNRDLALVDPADDRAITDLAREAVQAWIAERNTWVEGRGQIVGDANVKVWPGDIPVDEDQERVITGTFVPVTAPAKK